MIIAIITENVNIPVLEVRPVVIVPHALGDVAGELKLPVNNETAKVRCQWDGLRQNLHTCWVRVWLACLLISSRGHMCNSCANVVMNTPSLMHHYQRQVALTIFGCLSQLVRNGWRSNMFKFDVSCIYHHQYKMGLKWNNNTAPSLFCFSTGCVLWGSLGGAVFKIVASFRGRPTGLPLVPASGLFLVPLGRPRLRFSEVFELITFCRAVSRGCPKGIVCVSYLCLYIVMF